MIQEGERFWSFLYKWKLSREVWWVRLSSQDHGLEEVIKTNVKIIFTILCCFHRQDLKIHLSRTPKELHKATVSGAFWSPLKHQCFRLYRKRKLFLGICSPVPMKVGLRSACTQNHPDSSFTRKEPLPHPEFPEVCGEP